MVHCLLYCLLVSARGSSVVNSPKLERYVISPCRPANLSLSAGDAAAPAEEAPKKKKKKKAAIVAGEQAAADVARAVVEKVEGEKKKKKKKKATADA